MTLSVVIASGAGGEFLFRCLASLREQAARHQAPIIVVDRVGAAVRGRLRAEHPDVTIIDAPADPRPSIPALRRMGVEHATSDIVAVIEEHCVAPSGWLDAVVRSWRADDVAIGGPILDAQFERTIDWVVYFSEYHGFMPPWEDGARTNLNGANIAYRRLALLRHRDVLDSGYWEVVLHPKLAAEGAMRAIGDMGVAHTGGFSTGYYLRQRYLLSRVWGGTQKDRVPWRARVAHIALAPVMPGIMLGRIAAQVSSRPSLRPRLVRALPMLLVAMCALAAGEAVGYLAGPGRALDEVE